jgi:hypothetical protein
MTRTVATPAGQENGGPSLYVEYPREMMTAEGVKQLPRAPGLSGSGLWTVNPRVGGIWTPDMAKLVAIQRSWTEWEWLRGTLIREWLTMIREDLPELAGEIDPVLDGG